VLQNVPDVQIQCIIQI